MCSPVRYRSPELADKYSLATLSNGKIRMKNLTRFIVGTILMCSSGLVPAAYSCTIGLNSAQASDGPPTKEGTLTGQVRFRVVQKDCLSGATVTVTALAIDM